jgi:hypothetical protein
MLGVGLGTGPGRSDAGLGAGHGVDVSDRPHQGDRYEGDLGRPAEDGQPIQSDVLRPDAEVVVVLDVEPVDEDVDRGANHGCAGEQPFGDAEDGEARYGPWLLPMLAHWGRSDSVTLA